MTLHTAHWRAIRPAVPPDTKWVEGATQPPTERTIGDFIKGAVALPAGSVLRTTDFVGGALITVSSCDQVLAVGAFTMTQTWDLVIPNEVPDRLWFRVTVPGIAETDLQFEAVTPGIPPYALNTGWAFNKSDLSPGPRQIVTKVRGTVPPGALAMSATPMFVAYYNDPPRPPLAAPATLSATLTMTIEADEPPMAAGPNVLHFRDTDGVFKPLTEVRVRGLTP